MDAVWPKDNGCNYIEVEKKPPGSAGVPDTKAFPSGFCMQFAGKSIRFNCSNGGLLESFGSPDCSGGASNATTSWTGDASKALDITAAKCDASDCSFGFKTDHAYCTYVDPPGSWPKSYYSCPSGYECAGLTDDHYMEDAWTHTQFTTADDSSLGMQSGQCNVGSVDPNGAMICSKGTTVGSYMQGGRGYYMTVKGHGCEFGAGIATAPTTASPTTEPTTASPTTPDPTDSPTTPDPTTASPTSPAPTGSPTTPDPTTASPTTPAPTGSPTTPDPTTASPTSPAPTGSPTTPDPTTASPTTPDPTDSPTKPDPTTDSPTTPDPTTDSPITLSTTASPVTTQSTNDPATSESTPPTGTSAPFALNTATPSTSTATPTTKQQSEQEESVLLIETGTLDLAAQETVTFTLNSQGGAVTFTTCGSEFDTELSLKDPSGAHIELKKRTNNGCDGNGYPPDHLCVDAAAPCNHTNWEWTEAFTVEQMSLGQHAVTLKSHHAADPGIARSNANANTAGSYSLLVKQAVEAEVSSDAPTKHQNKNNNSEDSEIEAVVIGLGVAGGFLLFVLVFLIWWYCKQPRTDVAERRSRRKESEQVPINEDAV